MFEAETQFIDAHLAADLPGDLSLDRDTDLVGHRVAHLAGNLGKKTNSDGRQHQSGFLTWWEFWTGLCLHCLSVLAWQRGAEWPE